MAAPPALTANQIDERQKVEDELSYYRKGILWNEPIRRPFYRAHTVPRRPGGAAAWPGTWYADFHQPNPINPAAMAAAAQAAHATGRPGEMMSEFPRLARNVSGQPNPAGMRLSARRETKFMGRRLYRNWTHKRILGWGGNGVAALFKHRMSGRCVVVKCEIAGPGQMMLGSIQDEIDVMKKLQGSSHILPIEGSHRMPRLLRTPFYKRGPLTSAIIKAREVRRADETMSDDFLWHFGECLIRMAVGMRYPALNWTDTRSWNQRHVNRLILETVPTFAQTLPSPQQLGNRSAQLARLDMNNPGCFYQDHFNYVHFDIDPSNIFVDVNDEHHRVTPKLVLADFGSAESATRLRAQRSGDMSWDQRRIAKAGWYTPEQFTSEWAYVRRQAVREHTRIAGRYGEKSNIWQLGMVLHCLMTLTRPPRRPTPRWFPSNTGSHCTYGGYVDRRNAHLPDTRNLRFSGTDQFLRNLVGLCLRDDPARRPSLGALLTAFQNRVDQPPVLRPRELRYERDRYFVDPRTVSEAGPSSVRLERWLRNQINYVQMMNP